MGPPTRLTVMREEPQTPSSGLTVMREEPQTPPSGLTFMRAGPQAPPTRLSSRILGVTGILLIGAFAKLPETLLPVSTDTGMYATYARMMLQGGRPYVDFYDVHPPLTYYYWLAVQSLAGTDWSQTCVGSWGVLAPQPCISLLAHTLDLGLTCLTALVVYAIARRLGQPALVGLLAAVGVVWFANESLISMEGSNPTKLTMLPSALAMYAFTRARSSNAMSWPWAVLAGAAGLTAGLAKQPGLMTLIALFAYTLPGVFRGSISAPRARRLCLAMAIGALLVIVAVMVQMWRLGSLGGFIDNAWIYNSQRFLIGYWQTPAGLTSPSARIDRVVTQAAGLLFVGALIGGLSLWLSPSRPRQRLLLVWALFNLVAVAGFREFAQVVPSLALLAAIGIGRLWSAASRGGLGLGRPLAGQLALVVLLGTIFALTSSFQVTQLRRAWYERGPGGVPSDPELIATYLRRDAPPGPMFVWGNAGHIYALSGRPPATRFIIAEFTNATSPRPALSRMQLMDDVRANPPAVMIVDPHTDEAGLQLADFPALANLLASCYQPVSSVAVNTAWGIYVRATSGSAVCS
jgi:hypothetical protein